MKSVRPIGGRHLLLVNATAMASVTLLASVFGSSASGASGTTKTSGVTINLKVLDEQVAPDQNIIASLITAFEHQHPTVHVQLLYKPFADYSASAELEASASDGPDIVEISPASGNGTYSLVHNGLLVPLNRYAKQYGWTSSRYGSNFPLDLFSFTAKAAQQGTGSLYAIPEGFGEFEGIYYNRSLLKKLGLGAPRTMAEFNKSLAVAKSRHIGPIVVDSRDQYGWGFIWEDLSAAFTKAGTLNAWFFGDKGSTIVTPGTLEAAKLIQSWVKSGYLIPASIGYSESEADAAFAAGQALYQFEGTWEEPQFVQALKGNVGWMPVPISGGSPHALLGDPGWGWAITKISRHPGLAAELVSFLTGSTSRAVVLKGAQPVDTPGPLTGYPSGSVYAQQEDAFFAAEKASSLCPAMDAAFPVNPNHNAIADFQLLGLLKMTPTAFLADLQTGWSMFQATRQ